MSPTIAAIIGLTASLIAVIFVLHRAIQGGRTPQLRALAAGAVFSFAASLIRVPAISNLLVIGDVNVTWLATNFVGILCLYFMLCYMYFTVDDPTVSARQMTRQLRALVGACAILALLFTLAPHSREFDFGPQGRYTSGGSADTIFGPIAWLVLGAYLIYPLQDLVRVSLRWARKAASIRWLSIALSAYSLGAFISAVVQIHVIAYQVALLVPDLGPPPWPEAAVEAPPLAFAGVGTMVGLCATGVYSALTTSPRLRPVREFLHRVQLWWQYYVACRRLYPLWAISVAALPSVALNPPASRLADCLRFRAKLNLVRRTIELGDLRQAFRRYVPAYVRNCAEIVARKRGIDGNSVEAVLEAVVLTVGREAYLSRKPAAEEPVEIVDSTTTAGALDHEARHWLLISKMYFDNDLISDVLQYIQTAYDGLQPKGKHTVEQGEVS
jgi:hypothetical protein